MRTNEKTSALPASRFFDSWMSLMREPDQRFLTQKAICAILQTAANNPDEFGPTETEATAWLTMMLSWLTCEDGRERGFES